MIIEFDGNKLKLFWARDDEGDLRIEGHPVDGSDARYRLSVYARHFKCDIPEDCTFVTDDHFAELFIECGAAEYTGFIYDNGMSRFRMMRFNLNKIDKLESI